MSKTTSPIFPEEELNAAKAAFADQLQAAGRKLALDELAEISQTLGEYLRYDVQIKCREQRDLRQKLKDFVAEHPTPEPPQAA